MMSGNTVNATARARHQVHHRDDDADEGKQVQNAEIAPAVNIVERVDVARHPRREAPDRIAVEERHGQLLEMAEQRMRRST